MSSKRSYRDKRAGLYQFMNHLQRLINCKSVQLLGLFVNNCRQRDDHRSLKLLEQYRHCGRLLFKQLIAGREATSTAPSIELVSPPSTESVFDLLFNCDLLFDHIFVHLSYSDLFRVRGVNRAFHRHIELYFSRQNQIDLSDVNVWFDSIAFEVLVRQPQKLIDLNLANCKWLASSCLLRSMSSNAFQLKSLDLSGCRCLNDRDLQSVFSYDCLRSLRTIKLNNCHWLSRESLNRLIRTSGTTLRDVQLASCWQLDDHTIERLATGCPSMESLVLARVYSVNDCSLTLLSQIVVNLRYLDVSGCWRVTDRGIQ
jgi:hypothetical protein